MRESQPLGKLADDLIGVMDEARVRPDPRSAAVLHVRPSTPAEVAAVMEVARRHEMPLLARAPGVDTSELTPPAAGGVVVDLLPLNRVVEVDHPARCALVEPGVTWQGLDKFLRDDGGDLAAPFSATPSTIGPWATCLVDGAEGTGLSLGNVDDVLWGVEALLPTGETVRTGSRAASGEWWGRGPTGDLTSLFPGWMGATGIVTKLAIGLRQRRRYSRRLMLPASEQRLAIAASIRLARSGLFDDAQVIPWELLHCFLGSMTPIRHPTEPPTWLSVDFEADSLPELEYKRVALAQALAKACRRGGRIDDPVPMGSIARLTPSLAPLLDLPLCLPGEPSLAPTPKARIVLAFQGPTRALVDGAKAASAAFAGMGCRAAVLVRPLPGGHTGTMNIALAQTRAAPPNAREATAMVAEQLCEAGFVSLRSLPGITASDRCRRDPGALAVGERLRTTLDPDGMLDPSRWCPRARAG